MPVCAALGKFKKSLQPFFLGFRSREVNGYSASLLRRIRQWKLPDLLCLPPHTREMMTMMTFMISRVSKFDMHNYNQCKLDMELRFTSAGLWHVINEDRHKEA